MIDDNNRDTYIMLLHSLNRLSILFVPTVSRCCNSPRVLTTVSPGSRHSCKLLSTCFSKQIRLSYVIMSKNHIITKISNYALVYFI